MRIINAGLNGLIILASLYTMLTIGNMSALFIALIAASGIASTLSHQKMSLAWFAYLGNILCTGLLIPFGFITIFGGSANGNEALLNGVIILVASVPFAINVFFVKIRYFPSKLRNVS